MILIALSPDATIIKNRKVDELDNGKIRFSRETCSVVTKIIPIILSGGAGTRLYGVTAYAPETFHGSGGKAAPRTCFGTCGADIR